MPFFQSSSNPSILPPKSPFLAPRRASNPEIFDGHSNHDLTAISSIKSLQSDLDPSKYTTVEPEHKSNLMGCTANLITAIVGAGVIGIPYAFRETGLCAGWAFILLSAVMGCKSLRLLVETAKHVDAPSYETLSEAAFGRNGWILCNLNMFFMAWGPMLSYMMIVKDTLGRVLGYPEEDVAGQKMVLAVSSVLVMLPLSLQRDMADLAKTSRLSVLFDIFLVAIVAIFSPTSESIHDAGGIINLLSQSTFRPGTCFIGLGIISFAFSCQHSSLIIAGSLDNPTRERWSKVTLIALAACATLATFMGTFGYIGFLEYTEGDVLNNFPMLEDTNNSNDMITARAANIARGLLCCTMFFVYPLESFVARHVIMTNLFRGREAHEGDDHAVLDRWDRRVATTIVLFTSVLIPALICTDVGLVLAWTGTVAATNLAYIGPGILFIGVHGQEFLDLVECRWGFTSRSAAGQALIIEKLVWYLLGMPLWCSIASIGKKGYKLHLAKKAEMTPAIGFRLGKIKHKHYMHKMHYPHHRKMFEPQHLGNGDTDDEGSSPCGGGCVKTSVELGLITASHPAESYGTYSQPKSLGNGYELIENTEDDDSGEEDPQDEKQSGSDFVVAIAFIVLGLIALVSGICSICLTSGDMK
mmetsp:Transcript_30963/g.62319  ORF Transcript_30963/g.62319 Transcript_30963/m.62319 type:complete len:641 (-) Transcript_30963:29-1951(-)